MTKSGGPPKRPGTTNPGTPRRRSGNTNPGNPAPAAPPAPPEASPVEPAPQPEAKRPSRVFRNAESAAPSNDRAPSEGAPPSKPPAKRAVSRPPAKPKPTTGRTSRPPSKPAPSTIKRQGAVLEIPDDDDNDGQTEVVQNPFDETVRPMQEFAPLDEATVAAPEPEPVPAIVEPPARREPLLPALSDEHPHPDRHARTEDEERDAASVLADAFRPPPRDPFDEVPREPGAPEDAPVEQALPAKTKVLQKQGWLASRIAAFRKRSWWRRWLAYLFGGGVLAVCLGLVAFAVVIRLFTKDLPDISWAERYRPPLVSDVLSADDQLLGEFYNERRKVVPYDRIPKKLVQAFVAAEDDRFFDHPGYDPQGIARAIIQNALAGRKKSGASTLTQQTAKAILISTWGFERATRKDYKRKVYELLLARQLEHRFTKEEILFLYLNQVYLGHSSYGVQAAAENYFRKNVWDLTLGEMSLLAGLPQAPSKYSPFTHSDRAIERRKYVLRRMLEEGMITKEDHDKAAAENVTVYPVEDFFHETAPYVTEHVRRDILERYTNDRLLTDGLKIYATVDQDLEREATAATLKGLLAADKRQGFRGPLLKLEPKKPGLKPGSKAWNDGVKAEIDAFRAKQRKKGAAPESAESMKPTEHVVAVVLSVAKDRAVVGIGDKIEATMPLELSKWARKPNSEVNVNYWNGLDSLLPVLSPGDVVLVRSITKEERERIPHAAAPKLKKGQKPPPEEAEPFWVTLEQEPALQGALVSMDPKSGYIVAMIGGYDFDKSEFNRAFQSCRQPGSSFKPIVYSAAIEKLNWTPSTQLLDAPLVYDDPANEVRWKPSNFEESFKGDVPLREAVVNSMNIPAVRTLEAVGAKEAAAWANKLGITDKLNEDLSIALGSSCVKLWDLTHVYALFNQHGRRVKSTFIRRIVDRDGRILEDHSSYYDPWTTLRGRMAAGYGKLFDNPEQVIQPVTAFLMTNLMREVAKYGTAARAQALGRIVAGKTGTTNDAFDAWFMGFSPELVTGAWVGFDTYEMPMAKYETGGHTALPIWMDFMAAALKGRPEKGFEAPPGIVWVNINPKTGKYLPPDAPNGLLEAYKAGTEPVPDDDEDGTPSGTKQDFFRNQEL